MKAFIVYCHPSDDSFTRHLKDEFIRGIVDSGNEFEISDLYKMGFKTDMSEAEYLREAYYIDDGDVEQDVLDEQRKVNACDAIAFIYPVFWTEAPAKLVGWFDRVWTYGFAYGDGKTMRAPSRALFLCVSGHTRDDLVLFGNLQSMENVMIRDRLFERADRAEMHVFDGMTREYESRKANWDRHLKTAYELGRSL